MVDITTNHFEQLPNVILFYSGIIPSKYIAGVMNDGKFSGHLITGETQIVFMDEWTPDSLSCEDAKRVLQGMYSSIFIHCGIPYTYHTHVFLGVIEYFLLLF